MLTKTQIINSLEQLPENLTIDQLVDHLIFVEKVEKGLDDSINGRVHSKKEAQLKLNERINPSEYDIRINRFKNSTELSAKYK